MTQESESNSASLRDTEAERNKASPGTFEALGSQYHPYWASNTAKRLKINALLLYKSYLHDNFDSLIDAVKEMLNEETDPEEAETSAGSAEEQVKVAVVPFNQVLRKDLSVELRPTIIEKLSSAIYKYSDFACIFFLVVQLTMTTFTMSDGNPLEMNTIMPSEFQRDTAPVVLPASIRNASSDDADYKTIFSLNHLQVVSTLNFGAVRIQKQARAKYPLCISTHEQVQAGETSQAENSPQPIDNDVNGEVQYIFAEVKDFNATIKKPVTAQFSTNLDLMYKNGKRLKNAIEKTLRILLKLHIRPKKERSRRKLINELQTTSDTSHTVVIENSIFSRNKRPLLNKDRKQLQKYQEKNKTSKAAKVARKIKHIKELQWKKKAIYELDTADHAVNKYIFYI
ncbi:hypothetical protein BCV72DRAFT_334860 [Rhizopus microsporus var. microsporus]|uniref:Uncharacterized protein n=1 Tax=Rhizopus microsporus var. microsporus TaxID=86635 RepID=A0A1X0R7A2_RHIZD|nr:hypothetical protein BCV72DRAFT_334860 [Rhizopus microsporus var. microsporus]